MTAKEYLSQARHLDKRINSKIQMLEELNAAATKCTATYTDMPKAPSNSRSRVEDIVIKIILLQEEINKDIDRLIDIKAEIYKVISQVDSPELALILEKRYMCQMTFEELAEDLGYEERWIYVLHGKALKKVQNILEKCQTVQ